MPGVNNKDTVSMSERGYTKQDIFYKEFSFRKKNDLHKQNQQWK